MGDKTFLTLIKGEGTEWMGPRIVAKDWEIAQRMLDTAMDLGEVPQNTIVLGELVYEAPYQGIICPN